MSGGAAKAPAEKTPLAANAEPNPVWMTPSSLPYSGHPPESRL
jgi:hypothetical protein